MSASVLLLSAEYQPISLISVKKAIRLIVKQKVDVVKSTTIRAHKDLFIPRAVRLLKSISHLYKREIPWNKGNVFVRDNYTCTYCGTKLHSRNATVDHIVPQSKGGKNSWMNTITSCKKCNNSKGDKYLHETKLVMHKQPFVPSLWTFIQAKLKGLDYDMASIWEQD